MRLRPTRPLFTRSQWDHIGLLLVAVGVVVFLGTLMAIGPAL